MPKHSKRIAARQAALGARKKKRTGARPPPIYQEAPTTTAPEGSSTSTEARVNGAAQAPPLAVPRRPAPALERPRFSPRVTSSPVPGRRATPVNPYLKSDLARIGILSALVLVILIVLGVLVG